MNRGYGCLVLAPLPSVTRRLLIGLDVLVAGLLVVAALRPAPFVAWWVAALVAVAFAVGYAAGRATIRVDEAPLDARRGGWRPSGIWITALLLVWVALLFVSDGALWIAFPMMLLQMHVLGPRHGVVAVAVTTALAVGDGMLEQTGTGFSIGDVLGPVVGASVAVAVVLGYEALVRESQERQRTVDELRLARQDVAIAVHEAAVASERERLARDIHDTLAQGFSAIELLLRAAELSLDSNKAKTSELIEQARRTAQDNLGEARQFVQALAPVDLVGVSLVAALTRVAHRAQELAASEPTSERSDGTVPSSLAVAFRMSGVARPLPLPIETALVRVAQSALANVVAHAGARHAALTLTFLPDAVILDVVDDGCGFDPAALGQNWSSGGFGLPAIRSRMRELGGTLTLETGPGDGTAVAVRVPLDGVEETTPKNVADGEEGQES